MDRVPGWMFAWARVVDVIDCRCCVFELEVFLLLNQPGWLLLEVHRERLMRDVELSTIASRAFNPSSLVDELDGDTPRELNCCLSDTKK